MDVDISEDTRKLADQLGVVALYRFGSRVRGVAEPGSDYDVAVLLRDDQIDVEPLARSLSKDWELQRHQVDLRILNDAAPAFQFQVFRDRSLFYESNRDLRARHEAFVVKEYLDDDCFRSIHAQARRQRLKEGRFGHRPSDKSRTT